MERLHSVAVDGGRVHLLGTIQGLAAEAGHVRRAFERVAPNCVAVGVGPEDLRSLDAILAKGAPKVEEFETSSYEDELLERLKKFGELSVPPADLLEAVRLGHERGVAVEAIDLDDDTYTDLYTKEVGFWQLVRHNRQLKTAPALKFRAPDAESFIMEWDREFTRLKAYRKIEALREGSMASRLRSLSATKGTVLAVVPLQRLEGVKKALEDFSTTS